MNTSTTNEMDTIIELTETVAPTLASTVESQGNDTPLRMAQGEASEELRGEAVFEALKAPKSNNGASFMPPYGELVQEQACGPESKSVGTPVCEAVSAPPCAPLYDPLSYAPLSYDPLSNAPLSIEDDAILELDSATVVHAPYTVTTELFLDPKEQEALNKQTRYAENLHIDTMHADAMHVGEMHINAMHTGNISCAQEESAHCEHAHEPYVTNQGTHKAGHGTHTTNQGVHTTGHGLCDAPAEPQAHDENKEIVRDIHTLQTTLASLQLRLAAQDACIASLESRLMAAEAKNRELAEQCAQSQAPQLDASQIEKMTATTAARIVREEIQALLELAEQQS